MPEMFVHSLRDTVMACCLVVAIGGCQDAGRNVDGARGGASDAEALGATCWPAADVVGPEDFAIEQRRERLLVSSQDRRAPEQDGAIYAVSLDRGPTHALPLRGRGQCSFHPHGIFLAENTEPPRLYVINHHDARDTTAERACFPSANGRTRTAATSIEVFEVHRHELRFMQRLADPDVLTNGNDLVTDGDGNLFVTVPPAGGGSALVELLGFRGRLAMALSKTPSKVVTYTCATALEGGRCDGEWTVVAIVGSYVNGIALVRGGDQARLVVSSTIDGRLFELEREDHHDGVTWKQTEIRHFAVGHDNLLWQDDTRTALLVTSHPDLRRFGQHARSPRVTSPSTVWRVPIDRQQEVEAIFQDDGGTISGASTAACADGTLILGQVFGGEILRCQRPDLCRPIDPPNDQPTPAESTVESSS